MSGEYNGEDMLNEAQIAEFWDSGVVVVESAYSAADVEPGHSVNASARVVPDSHRGPLHSLWHNDKFTEAVDDALAADCETSAAECLGPAGS